MKGAHLPLCQALHLQRLWALPCVCCAEIWIPVSGGAGCQRERHRLLLVPPSLSRSLAQIKRLVCFGFTPWRHCRIQIFHIFRHQQEEGGRGAASFQMQAILLMRCQMQKHLKNVAVSNFTHKNLSPLSTASVFICVWCQGRCQDVWVINGNPFVVHHLHAGGSRPPANNNRKSLHLRVSEESLLGFLIT